MQLINPTLKIGREHSLPANQYSEVGEELQQFSLACVFAMAGQLPQRRLTHIEMAQGVGMLQAGSSQRQVARALNVNQSVISRMLIRYQTTGTVSRRHSSDRTCVTTQREDRFLVVQAHRHPFWTATHRVGGLYRL
jgi:hypothetical protein